MGFAHRRFFEPRTYVKELKKVAFSFAPAGTSAPDNFTGHGFATIVRDGVGEFTVTLEDKWVDLVSARAALQLATPANQKATIGAYDPAAKTVQVFTDAADVAVDASNRVNVTLWFKNTRAAR